MIFEISCRHPMASKSPPLTANRLERLCQLRFKAGSPEVQEEFESELFRNSSFGQNYSVIPNAKFPFISTIWLHETWLFNEILPFFGKYKRRVFTDNTWISRMVDVRLDCVDWCCNRFHIDPIGFCMFPRDTGRWLHWLVLYSYYVLTCPYPAACWMLKLAVSAFVGGEKNPSKPLKNL